MKPETSFKNQFTQSECSIGIEQNIPEKLILPDRSIREGIETNKSSLSHQLLKWLCPENQILIIEDQLPDKHRCNLDRSGVTPDLYVIAESLDEALQLMRQGNIGLIITDLDFPMKRDEEIVRLNGRRIIQAAQMVKIPVLLSSSRAADDIALEDINIPQMSKGDWDERDLATVPFSAINWDSLENRPQVKNMPICEEKDWYEESKCCMDYYSMEHVRDVANDCGLTDTPEVKFLNEYPCLNGLDLDYFVDTIEGMEPKEIPDSEPKWPPMFNCIAKPVFEGLTKILPKSIIKSIEPYMCPV